MIVLYGSYAKGTASNDSDIDIAVICDSLGADFLEKAQQLFKLRRDIDFRIEPIEAAVSTSASSAKTDILPI